MPFKERCERYDILATLFLEDTLLWRYKAWIAAELMANGSSGNEEKKEFLERLKLEVCKDAEVVGSEQYERYRQAFWCPVVEENEKSVCAEGPVDDSSHTPDARRTETGSEGVCRGRRTIFLTVRRHGEQYVVASVILELSQCPSYLHKVIPLSQYLGHLTSEESIYLNWI